ncbi:MAG: serpin family protein [Saccharofermentanales bacterium]
MHKYLIFTTALILLLLTSACCTNQKEAKPADFQVIELNHEITATELAAQNNSFAFDLWQQIDQKDQNLFLSPYSINTAMGMAFTGAKGNTAKEMGQVMGYPYGPQQQHLLFKESRTRLDTVQGRKKAQLHIANAMFSSNRNKTRTVAEFPQTLKDSFLSELQYLDFQKPQETANYINNWVEERTNKRIKNIVSEDQIANSNDGLVLVNSIFFKSAWGAPFVRESTLEDKFFTSSKREQDKYIILPLMQQTGSFYYAELAEGQLLELPYEDFELSLIIMLPHDIDQVSANLNASTWQSWMKSLKELRRVNVILPKFRLEQTLDKLPETFKALGMKDAFDEEMADFSGILKLQGQNLFISDIVHKAFLEVTEEGSEAAAATQIGFSVTSAGPIPPQPPRVFRADKPFLCMIIHKAANEILFMGKVQKPAVIED